MKKSILNKIWGTPEWGTLVAGTYTFATLVEVHKLYSLAELSTLAALCFIELTILDICTKYIRKVRYPLLKTVLLLPLGALGSIYVFQLYSIWISGGFIPPIAFANQEVNGLISFRTAYALCAVYLVAFFAGAFRPRQTFQSIAPSALIGLAVAISAYVPLIIHQPLARGIIIARGESPLSSFVHSVAKFSRLGVQAHVSTRELSATREQFTRKKIYAQGFPEELTRNLPKRPNVIVIFTEGMSARWINAYGGLHPGLSDNLDRLANSSLVFENYFNHTAATFRGLRGQLTSGHQEEGGYNKEGTGVGQRDVSGDLTAISRVSIPDILRSHGYNSMFFLSQQEYIVKMIETLGFDRTLGRDYIYNAHLKKPGDKGVPKFLTDPDLFEGMIEELEAQPSDRPFFAAVYNFQTHAFMDGKYKYGDGSNQVLNRFYSYDKYMGQFLQRFMASKLHENTVLVFTSDHSTYPDPPAVQADDRMARYFVDTIPLMIYWKGVEHRTINVNGKNSLDLAPTVLSLLKVKNGRNLFLGCTFFEECRMDHISNLGMEYILTDKDNSYSEPLVPMDKKGYFYESRKLIEQYKTMDQIVGNQ